MAEPSPETPAPEAADRAAPEPADEAAGEAEAWAEVTARWGEVDAHHAYLARWPDLDGLAAAGARYRAVLADRPRDEMALAMRAEILKRATVVGLATLPRTAPPGEASGRWKRVALILLAAWLGAAAAYLVWKLLTGPVL